MESVYQELADQINRYLSGQAAKAYNYKFEKPDQQTASRLAVISDKLDQSPYGHNLGQKLIDYVVEEPEVELSAIRPLQLARLWQVDDRYAVELCFQATRIGLLDMRWDLLCPRCQMGKVPVSTLKNLQKTGHCESCNIKFDQDFSSNVELVFQPNPSVRIIEAGEYCMMGPMSTPHIVIQQKLVSGEQIEIKTIDMLEGNYRARTLAPGSQENFIIDRGEAREVHYYDDHIDIKTSQNGKWRLLNHSKKDLAAVIEAAHWKDIALTADQATSYYAFRDLFSEQIFNATDDAEIKSLTIMFTDLKSSTAMYDEIGDPAAYQLVRDHFLILGDVVREHNGALVKMIGDAIMAVFYRPEDALDCAIAIHVAIEKYNDQSDLQDIVIEIGLHTGRCIAVTINERLDYYGSTANMAARLQAQSVGWDIVLSESYVDDPVISEKISGLDLKMESCLLKGFAEKVPFYRYRYKPE